jgi:spermidine synthase
MGNRDAEPDGRIGVVGLGIGTLAAYASAGETIRFYEIDPAVVRIARDDGLFHFLEDTAANVEIVIGDARLALGDEQARGIPQSFDYLIIDAFNSDAVPVHLLTVEAFAHYALALAPEGLLGVHTSNRHFELMPLVIRMGLELGLHGVQIVNRAVPRLQSRRSQWVWLSRDPERIRELAERVRQRHASLGLEPEALTLRLSDAGELLRVPVWTDDYSDLFGLLRRRGGG